MPSPWGRASCAAAHESPCQRRHALIGHAACAAQQAVAAPRGKQRSEWARTRRLVWLELQTAVCGEVLKELVLGDLAPSAFQLRVIGEAEISTQTEGRGVKAAAMRVRTAFPPTAGRMLGMCATICASTAML